MYAKYKYNNNKAGGMSVTNVFKVEDKVKVKVIENETT